MVADETGKRRGIDRGAVVLIGLAVLAFAYALSLFLQGAFLAVQNRDRQRKLTGTDDPLLVETRRAQRAKLEDGPRWLDREAGVVAIPIADAMRLVVEREGGDAAGGGAGGAGDGAGDGNANGEGK